MPNPQYMLPGLKPVLELLRHTPGRIEQILLYAGCRACEKVAALAEEKQVPVRYAESAQLDRLCADRSGIRIAHQGVIAALTASAPLSLADLLACPAPLRLILALDQVQDPGNLGTIARTAWAMGCIGIMLPEHNSAPLGPAAMRSSAGALALLPLCRIPNLARALDKAEEAGFAIFGTGQGVGNTSNAFQFAWPLPAVLVLGGEANGLRPGVAKRCGQMIEIPMPRKFDSLNVAQAGAILIALCAAKNAALP